MNSNRRVLLFVVYSVGIFLLFSIAGYYFNWPWAPLQRVNLVSDVVKLPEIPKPVPVEDTVQPVTPPVVVEALPKEDFNLYHTPRFITDFNADTTRPSLDSFMSKLHDLKMGKKRKVRIAYFGDSMIEGDLMTQTLRRLLQDMFGGEGVGFVPITSPISKFRMTAIADFSDDWEEDNFIEGKKSSRLFLSGHLFHTDNGWVQIRDQTVRHDSIRIEKSLLCGYTGKPVSIVVNNKSFRLNADSLFNRVVLAKDYTRRVKLLVNNDKLPLYGVTFESDSGIFIDNFAFRGITGIEFARMDTSFLQAIAGQNPYDLVVFQYGVNLLYRPRDKDFNWYAELMLPVIRKFQKCFAGSDFLLVSSTDRAFRYNGEYKSAIGIDSLIRIQAMLAYQTGSSFYNQFATMGGANSIVEWARMKPPQARKDYVHPNPRGSELLANYLFEAIKDDYDKYIESISENTN